MKSIKLESGVKVKTFKSPPAGLDPFAVRPEDLIRFGLPQVPGDARHRERYRQVFSQVKNKLTMIEPTFQVNAGIKHVGLRSPAVPAAPLRSGGLSGGLVVAPAGQSFRWIQADWVLPNVDALTRGTWYHASIWIGVNSFKVGIHCECLRYWTGLSRVSYPFWQWEGDDNEVGITNFTVTPGDMITVVLCTPEGPHGTDATVFFLNRTTGMGASMGLTAPPSDLVSDEALWVVEAPLVGAAQAPLADYGEVFFSECEVMTSGSDFLGGGTGFAMDMAPDGTDVVSQGNLISPTVVQCLYTGASPS